jgi:hypothetical protein
VTRWGAESVDIHKPKPWRGFREFLKEYAIIVVGVLTALGAEQAVEWAHRGAEVREAREALHTEMGRSLRTLTLEAREDGCWQGAVGAYEAWAKGTGRKPEWPGSLMQGLGPTVWEVAKTGAVPHMDLVERVQIAKFYSGIENQQAAIQTHRQLALEFAGYRNRDSLDTEEAHALLRLLGQIRASAASEARNVPGILEQGRKLGVAPAAPVPEYEARVERLCAAFPAPPPDAGR